MQRPQGSINQSCLLKLNKPAGLYTFADFQMVEISPLGPGIGNRQLYFLSARIQRQRLGVYLFATGIEDAQPGFQCRLGRDVEGQALPEGVGHRGDAKGLAAGRSNAGRGPAAFFLGLQAYLQGSTIVGEGQGAQQRAVDAEVGEEILYFSLGGEYQAEDIVVGREGRAVAVEVVPGQPHHAVGLLLEAVGIAVYQHGILHKTAEAEVIRVKLQGA